MNDHASDGGATRADHDDDLRWTEERLRLALDAGRTGVWEWDIVTGRITWSDRVHEFYGMRPGEFDGTIETFARHLHPDDADRAREAIRASVEDGIPYRIEYRIVQKGGDVRWINTAGHVVRGPDGTPLRMLGATSDVTDRKRADEGLRRSEERYRALANATSDVVYRMSPDWAVMQPLDGRGLVPSSAEPLRGWMEKNLPASEHARVRDAIARAVAGKNTFELEHRVMRPDGTLGWTYSRAVPMLDAAGDIVEWFGTARDVTFQKRAQEELARVTAESDRRKRLYESVLSSTPDLAYVFDLDHRFVYANDVLLRMWGRTWDEAIGKTCLELGYEPWHAEMHDREIEQVKATKQPVRGEVPFAGAFGRRVYEYIFVPVLGADGQVEAVAGTTRDVTERAAAEEALREADRRKDAFIAMLAHELRNPLGPIGNAVQVLGASRDAATVDRVREMVGRQVDHLSRIVNDLLDVSRVARGKIDLRRERLDLARLASVVAGDEAAAFDAAGLELRVTVPDTPVWVSGDRTRLTQVVTNLLANAVKFTDRGGKVAVAVGSDGAEAVLTVADTGVGIEAGLLPHLFEAFTQADETLDRSRGGLGLGLSMAKGLVELHGGGVSAESPGPGAGATFTVRLPRIEEPAALTTAPPPARVSGSRRLRVLIVEDNRDAADSLQMLLELTGCEVRVAYTGPDGVAAAIDMVPDLVVCDIGLPGYTGYEVARRIRAAFTGGKPVLVALTGYGDDGDRRQAKDAGFDRHFTKPVDPAALGQLLAS